jgi:hypothetical protein
VTWFSLALPLILLGASPSKNELKVRVFPSVSIASPSKGCSEILFTVEISGPETEAWYCPKVEWEFPDDTRASEESDCTPFQERTDFPRIWRKKICAPSHPRGGEWEVVVRLSKGKTLGKATIYFSVK